MDAERLEHIVNSIRDSGSAAQSEDAMADILMGWREDQNIEWGLYDAYLSAPKGSNGRWWFRYILERIWIMRGEDAAYDHKHRSE